MSRREFDDSALAAALGGKVPATSDRARRVHLLGEFAEAALSGREPSESSLLFLAGAVSAWLQNGGDLERDYLRVTAPAGSHHTPARLWCSSRGATDSEDADRLSSETSDETST